MKVFVAGATGVIGRRLVPLLLDRGHEVTAMTHTPSKADAVRALGADPIVADGLSPDAVLRAVSGTRPDVVVHQMTALSGMGENLRRFDRDFELTNRLRTEGTDALLAAVRTSGARRFVAQSFAGWPYAREGGWIKTEEDPLDPSPPRAMRRTLAAIRHLERAVMGTHGIEGLVLRYGTLYGPGTSIAVGGQHADLVRRRRFPIVGEGTAHWSFVHVDDAVAATLAAIETGAPSVYNVVDDEPAPVSHWLPQLAEALGAKPPRRIPLWVGRLATGEVGVSLMTQVRGASNEKARRELGWRPHHPSWRSGFREGPGDSAGAGGGGEAAASDRRQDRSLGRIRRDEGALLRDHACG